MTDVTDSWFSEQFVKEHGDLLRHAVSLGWFRWDGKVWDTCSEDRVVDEVHRFVKTMLRSAIMTSDRDLINALTRYLSTSAIRRVVLLVRTMLPVRVDDVSEFDADPDLLNCQNGIVDLRYGDLRPHDPAQMMTKICGAEYDPNARHVDIDAVLDAMPDASVRGWMQQVLGSACSGRTPADDLSIVLDGGGSNGKSTLTSAAHTALGSYAGVVPDTVLAGGQEHPTGLSEFRGLRLAILDETPEERRLNVQLVKKLSSGNEVKARRMRMDFFAFMPSHTLIVATNHKPVVTETDRGTWRRLALVPFPVSYGDRPGDKSLDPGLRDRVRESPNKQAQAMLAWMVHGAKIWYHKQRLLTPLPPAIQAATQAWRDETDVVSMFARDALRFDPAASITQPDMFRLFTSWQTDSGVIGFKSARSFNAALRAHEIAVERGVSTTRSAGKTWWIGVESNGAVPVVPMI